ncbi:MAG: hypothetical protein WCG27_10690 [Pseudomonadota bacterium]
MGMSDQQQTNVDQATSEDEILIVRSSRKKKYKVPTSGKVLMFIQLILLVDACLTYFKIGLFWRFFIP